MIPRTMMLLVAAIALAGCPRHAPKEAPTVVSDPGPRGARVDRPEGTEIGPLQAQLRDIHFDFDRAEIRDDARPILEEDAAAMNRFPQARIVVQGHCDERGSVEYNLALGERRAKAARDHLVSLGIAPGRMSIVSYGKELPLEPGHDETAWAANRRAHFLGVQ